MHLKDLSLKGKEAGDAGAAMTGPASNTAIPANITAIAANVLIMTTPFEIDADITST
jgi:hypothetical protein